MVGPRCFMKRSPGADIAPARVERHDNRVARFLHHRVVDRLAAATLEFRRRQPSEFQIHLRRGYGLLAHVEDVRRETFELLDIAASLENEHTAVPEVLA